MSTSLPRLPLAELLVAPAVALGLGAAFACGGQEAETPDTAPPELTRLFVVDSLRSPSSVAWDSARNRYLVTSGEGDSAAGEVGGFVAAVSASGDSVDRGALNGGSPGTALDAPRGIAVRGDRAWIADGDRVVGVDLTADTALFAVRVPDSRSLHDVSVLGGSAVHASDPDRDAVYRIAADGSGWSRHGAAGSLRGATGIHPDPSGPGLLVAGREGAVLRLAPDSSVTLLAEPLDAGSLEGIQSADGDRILYSDVGRGTLEALHRRRPGRWEPSAPWIDDLRAPADFLRRGSLLAVPERAADRVVFYRISDREVSD